MSSLHHWLVALARGLKRDKHKRRIEEESAPGSPGSLRPTASK